MGGQIVKDSLYDCKEGILRCLDQRSLESIKILARQSSKARHNPLFRCFRVDIALRGEGDGYEVLFKEVGAKLVLRGECWSKMKIVLRAQLT
jgi:hypothetical protein